MKMDKNGLAKTAAMAKTAKATKAAKKAKMVWEGQTVTTH